MAISNRMISEGWSVKRTLDAEYYCNSNTGEVSASIPSETGCISAPKFQQKPNRPISPESIRHGFHRAVLAATTSTPQAVMGEDLLQKIRGLRASHAATIQLQSAAERHCIYLEQLEKSGADLAKAFEEVMQEKEMQETSDEPHGSDDDLTNGAKYRALATDYHNTLEHILLQQKVGMAMRHRLNVELLGPISEKISQLQQLEQMLEEHQRLWVDREYYQKKYGPLRDENIRNETHSNRRTTLQHETEFKFKTVCSEIERSAAFLVHDRFLWPVAPMLNTIRSEASCYALYKEHLDHLNQSEYDTLEVQNTRMFFEIV